MSIEVITSLLDKKFVDANVRADSLSSILTELCLLVSGQSKQLFDLANFKAETERALPKFVARDDYAKDVAGIRDSLGALREEVAGNHSEVLSALAARMSEKDRRMEEVAAALAQQMEGVENLSNTQQVHTLSSMKEMKADFAELSGRFQALAAEIAKANKDLSILKDLPVDDIMNRIRAAEESTQSSHALIAALENNVRTANETINQRTKEFQKDIASRTQQTEKEIVELKHIVIDAPTFLNDGHMDIAMVISAVNRDTRRIDSFNEIISQLKNSFGFLVEKFESLENGYKGFEFSFAEFAQIEKQTNDMLAERTVMNQEKCNNLANDVLQIFNFMSSLTRMHGDILNRDVTTLQGLVSLLEKYSNRPIPPFAGYDDYYTDMQEFNQTIQVSIDQYERITISSLKKKFDELPTPFYYTSTTQDVILENEPSTQQRQQQQQQQKTPEKDNVVIKEIKDNITQICDSIVALKRSLESKIDCKADSQQTERMFERLKSALTKQKEYCKSQLYQSQRQEVPSILQQTSQRPATVTGQRLRQSSNLPRISSHEALYGTPENRRPTASAISLPRK